MIERLLIGFLASGQPEETLNSTEVLLPESTAFRFDFQGASKFHVGMLSLSLMVGLAYGGFAAYSCWVEENVFLSYCRNLVIALVFRTFFTLIFDAVVFLDNPFNIGGGNTLSAFESISQNLVIAFWLLITVYLHARMQRNFNNEPGLFVYQFAIPGVAVFFSLVWIFAMEGEYTNLLWWTVHYTMPYSQWITNSLRLLYLLAQLALLFDIARMTMNKSSLDSESISLLRKLSILMGVLVFLFWLHFGLSVGRPSWNNPQTYFYFFYFVDGLLCAAVCPIFFFMDRWVPSMLDKVSQVLTTDEEPRGNVEVCVNGTGPSGNIVTIDSVMEVGESGKWPCRPGTDVVYSSVVHPDKLKNTFDLYKRLNAIPVVVGEDQFYDCGSQHSTRSQKLDPVPADARPPKKNAFYSSKYLIVEAEQEELPRYLETRGSARPSKAEGAPEVCPAPAERRSKESPETTEETGRAEGKTPHATPRNNESKNDREKEENGRERREESKVPVPKSRRKFSHVPSL